MKNLIIGLCVIVLLVLPSCGSGSNATSQIVFVPTFNYEPGSKTATYVSIGGGESVIAEIDTGSEMTVVNESFAGGNLIKTNESLTIVYGGGTNIVSGHVAYGVVEFTTTSGLKLKTSAQTPILLVESGSVNQGNGNNAILGMRMNNQMSSRLYLPYPYNQMMVLNRGNGYMAFGILNKNEINKFALIKQTQSECQNLIQTTLASNNLCWQPESSSTTYVYSKVDGNMGHSNYVTLFDSGEAHGNMYITPMPSWVELNHNGIVQNQISAIINTNKGPLPMPITLPLRYKQSLTPPGIMNPGSIIFSTYQMLFNQQDGSIGFLESGVKW